MLDSRSLFQLQSDYGVADGEFKDKELEFTEYLDSCRVFIKGNLSEGYLKGNLTPEDKLRELKNLTNQFVTDNKVRVKGYSSPEGLVNFDLLLEDIFDYMTGEAILKEALEDPEVDEIQINDKNTIFVQKNGTTSYYTDKHGRVPQFSTNDEIITLINKLIDDGQGNNPQFTEGNPILNAKTAKNQYRINAVHHTANTQDKPPHAFPITTVTIRKFKEVKLTIDDLVKGRAVTQKMARLLTLLGKAELRLFCVGPTGSGKTTLLHIIAQEIPMDKRILLVQNPSEITFKDRDEYGRNKRNVVHWEVTNYFELDDGISNTLRSTPEVIIVGESRENKEFQQALRSMRTGHKLLGTYHALDSSDAIDRFADEISSAGGTTNSEAVKQVSKAIDIIVSQFKFPDGTRRVMEIAEINGVDNNGDPNINKLFEFQLSGETSLNDRGQTVVHGEFKQVGKMSERVQKEFFKAGVSRKEIEEFLVIEDMENVDEKKEEAVIS